VDFDSNKGYMIGRGRSNLSAAFLFGQSKKAKKYRKIISSDVVIIPQNPRFFKACNEFCRGVYNIYSIKGGKE